MSRFVKRERTKVSPVVVGGIYKSTDRINAGNDRYYMLVTIGLPGQSEEYVMLNVITGTSNSSPFKKVEELLGTQYELEAESLIEFLKFYRIEES